MALMWTLAAGSAQAQESATASGGSATVSATGGLTMGMHGTGPVIGGAVTFDLNDWFAVEGAGAYFNRGSGADAISANASLLVNVLRVARPFLTSPLVAVSIGPRSIWRTTASSASWASSLGPARSLSPFAAWPASE
jgi:hypothetical protein